MGITASSASPAKATSKPILNLVTICSLLDLLLSALAPRHPCKVIRVGGCRFDRAWKWVPLGGLGFFPYPELPENIPSTSFGEEPLSAVSD
jgi:hypothetical protein